MQRLYLTILLLFITHHTYPQDFIPIWEMDDFERYVFSTLDLSDYEGTYKISSVINGEFDFSHFELPHYSDFLLEMVFDEATGYLTVSSNLPFSGISRLHSRHALQWAIGLLVADGWNGGIFAQVYITNRGLVLHCHIRIIDLDVNDEINYLLEKQN